MLDETDRFLRAQTQQAVADAAATSRRRRDVRLAALEDIYGVKPTDADGAKPAKLDPAQRLGIFSHPAVIASHSGPDGTRPIKRGVFWVRKVMCMELEPPPQRARLRSAESRRHDRARTHRKP